MPNQMSDNASSRAAISMARVTKSGSDMVRYLSPVKAPRFVADTVLLSESEWAISE
jgi:hypothetical protein